MGTSKTMRGLIAAVVTVIVAGSAVLAGSGAAAAAPDGESIAEKVGPAIVFLKIEYVSTVKIPFDDGADWSDPVTVTASCTGYLVDTEGSIATAGHCVDDSDEALADEMRQGAVVALAKRQNRSNAWATRIYTRAKSESWRVRGINGTTRTDEAAHRTVRANQPSGDGRILTDWEIADVVDFQSFDEGDNAVLALQSPPSGLVPLVISDAEPEPGDAITAIGFPGAVSRTVDPGDIPQPSYIDGKVSSRQTRASGVIGTEVSADLGKGMSGGPTVDSRGAVIGTNSWKTRPVDGDTASFSFLTDNRKLRQYLTANGVHLAEAPASSGLNKAAWIVPLIAVVILALGGALALVLYGRRPSARAPGPGAAGTGAAIPFDSRYTVPHQPRPGPQYRPATGEPARPVPPQPGAARWPGPRRDPNPPPGPR